jgi:hypothetical protein
MRNIKLKVKEADNKLAAYLNARERSAKARSNYTASEQQRANKVFEAVRTTYIRSKCYLTYRNNFIAIKVCNPVASDKLNAYNLETELNTMGVEKATTAQGIIYRIV